MRRLRVTAILGAGILAICAGCATPAPLRVLSFDATVECGAVEIATGDAPVIEHVPGGGVHPETIRRDVTRPFADRLRSAILNSDPDIIGLQGVPAAAASESVLPSAYEMARTGGRGGAEIAPILFRQRRFIARGAGCVSLETGSKASAAAGADPSPLLRRGQAASSIATWARLALRESPRDEVFVINARLASADARARVESARRLRQFIDAAGDGAVIVMVDLGSERSAELEHVLTRPHGHVGLRDTRVGDAYVGLSTFHPAGRLGGSHGAAGGPCRLLLGEGLAVVDSARTGRHSGAGVCPAVWYGQRAGSGRTCDFRGVVLAATVRFRPPGSGYT